MTEFRKSSIARRDFLKAAGATLALPALASIPATARAADPVEIEVWQWAPNFEAQMDLFHAAQDRIRIKHVNTGGGQEQVLKLRNAKLAGSGGPDVAFMDYALLASMVNIGVFADITQSAAEVVPRFAASAISATTLGGKMYLLPLDAPPLMQFYREDVLGEMGIELPETWDDFAAAAEAVRSKSDSQYLSNTLFTFGQWATGLAWQAGSTGFDLDGETITIQLNDEPWQKMAAFWQELIKNKLVGTEGPFTTNWNQGLDDGKYLDIIAGSWFPSLAEPNAKKSAGHWRAGFMPQWERGGKVSGVWGGERASALRPTVSTPRKRSRSSSFSAPNARRRKPTLRNNS